MESTSNIPRHHHHHRQQHPLQDHQLLGSSTTTTALDSSGYAAAPSLARAWTPSIILNNDGFGSASNAAIINSRNPRLQHDLLASHNGSMTQDSSFSWANSTSENNFTNQSSHDLPLEMIKREISDSYANFSEMISSPSSSIEDVQVQMQPTSYRKNDQRNIHDPNVELLLRTLSSGGQSNGLHQSCPDEFYCSTSSSSSVGATPKRGTFSQIYPSVNVSNFSQTSLTNSRSLDMNLQALDLLNSARFSGSFRQSMQDQLGLSKIGSLSYGYDNYLKQSTQMPMLEPTNITHFNNGVTEAKRSDISLEPKAPQAASKRSRVESRASCPPFKVRKEKLGDRIAALQQLVAPFGKTDTASVLMEAIGYIKFLQNQVETLSVPYLKSSRNKTSRAAVHGGSVENGSEERKRDLRSRGLCLVPVSCLTYVTDSGGGVWPPPSFGGGT